MLCRLYILSGIITITLLISSCKESTPTEETIAQEAQTNTTIQSQITEVKTAPATQGTFTLQKILNGQVEADRKTPVQAETGGYITTYHLTEGAYVQSGDLLISLEEEELQLQLEQRRNELDDAIAARNLRLVNDGGKANDETSVSPEKLKIINVLTGYNKALTAVRQAEWTLSRKKITAPISGWITDILVNDRAYVAPGTDLCTIVDPASFEIKFFLLENDALSTPIGTTITAFPLLNKDIALTGKIHKINPVVDKNGLVTVYARITSRPRKIFEGMNLRIELETKVPDQIIVPKSALVSRSGRDVIFVLDTASSLAKWKYVTVAHENKSSLAISDGINPGDQVIVEGNLNLDHDASVEIGEIGEIE